MDPNGVNRLLARISRFYQLPKAVIPPERYVRLIGVIFAKKGIDPHYLGLTEQYACRILRMEGEAVSKPPYAAAASASAAAYGVYDWMREYSRNHRGRLERIIQEEY